MAFSLKEGTAQRTAFGLAVLSTATQIALTAIITRLATITPNSSPVFAATLTAVVFDFIVLIILVGIVVFSLVARSRTSRTLQLSLSATSFVLFITASVLSIYVLGWTKVDSVHANNNTAYSQGAVLAGFVVWTINMVAQTMLHIFRSLRKREQAPDQHVESTIETQASPKSIKRSLSFPLKSLSSPSASPFLRSTFEVTSPALSTHHPNASTLRHSIQQAIRPITSRTKLMLAHTPTPRESGSFAAARENNSLEISCRGDGFEAWDTSSVEQGGFDNPFVTSPTTGLKKKLEPIPGSRPVSPAKPLDGPFPSVEDQPEKLPLPDSPMQSPMRYTSANDSTDTLPVPPLLLLHRNSSNSSSSQEAHIHPLFRSHSPTPPPTPSADTIITASPFAGQVIHGDHAMAPKRMQSARVGGGSQSTSPHAFTPPTRSGSFPSLRRPSNLSTRHPLELDPEEVPEMPKL